MVAYSCVGVSPVLHGKPSTSGWGAQAPGWKALIIPSPIPPDQAEQTWPAPIAAGSDVTGPGPQQLRRPLDAGSKLVMRVRFPSPAITVPAQVRDMINRTIQIQAGRQPRLLPSTPASRRQPPPSPIRHPAPGFPEKAASSGLVRLVRCSMIEPIGNSSHNFREHYASPAPDDRRERNVKVPRDQAHQGEHGPCRPQPLPPRGTTHAGIGLLLFAAAVLTPKLQPAPHGPLNIYREHHPRP